MTKRDSYLRRVYGITEAQYKDLLLRQGGCCAVCGKSPKTEGKNLSVDHNHHTLEVRGLLCTWCNRYVIGRHRDPDLLRRAAEYLAQGTGWFAPPKKKKKRRKPSLLGARKRKRK